MTDTATRPGLALAGLEQREHDIHLVRPVVLSIGARPLLPFLHGHGPFTALHAAPDRPPSHPLTTPFLHTYYSLHLTYTPPSIIHFLFLLLPTTSSLLHSSHSSTHTTHNPLLLTLTTNTNTLTLPPPNST